MIFHDQFTESTTNPFYRELVLRYFNEESERVTTAAVLMDYCLDNGWEELAEAWRKNYFRMKVYHGNPFLRRIEGREKTVEELEEEYNNRYQQRINDGTS